MGWKQFDCVCTQQEVFSHQKTVQHLLVCAHSESTIFHGNIWPDFFLGKISNHRVQLWLGIVKKNRFGVKICLTLDLRDISSQNSGKLAGTNKRTYMFMWIYFPIIVSTGGTFKISILITNKLLYTNKSQCSIQNCGKTNSVTNDLFYCGMLSDVKQD